MPEVLFVGREREKELFKNFLDRDTPWVLIITGLGGIGKSTLLHRLAEYAQTDAILDQPGLPDRHEVIMLDFANEELRSNPLRILDQLMKDTASCCDAQNDLRESLQQNLDQLEQIRAERLQKGFDESSDRVSQEIRYQMRALATEVFYAHIKSFQHVKLVMMLDTCEWLNEPEGQELGQWVFNELVPGIRTRLRQQRRQCFVVIASRMQPRLDAINGKDQRRISLPMLSEADVNHYLEHMGMQDAHLRQQVYAATHGHALCVSIIGDFWQQRDEHTQSITFADLPELQIQEFSEIALMRFTNERVLKQLRPPFKELTSFGILLRSFDLPMLRNVFPEFLPETEALERFDQLIRYPYIESRGNYRYAFHELLREALSEETQKEALEQWLNYHKRALDYLTETALRSPDWYYHLLAYDEKQGLAEWQQAIQEARNSGKREYEGTLLQIALDKALKPSPIAHAKIEYEQGCFNYYRVQWDDALHNYQEALSSFKKIDDIEGQAKVLQAMGDVQRVMGKQDDALTSYEQALVAFQQVGNANEQANVLQAMGDMQSLRGNPDIALQNYDQALIIFRQVGNISEEAKVLEAMGDVQHLRNNLDIALSYYEQALVIYIEGKNRLKRAKILKTIGDIYRLRQENDMALEYYRQALALFGELKELAEETSVRRAIDEIEHPQDTFQPVVLPTLPKDATEPIPQSASSQGTSKSIALPLQKQLSGWSRRGTVLFSITLALLLVVSSGFLYYVNVVHPNELQVQAIALVKSQNTKTAIAEHNKAATEFVQVIGTATAANTFPDVPGNYSGTLTNNANGGKQFAMALSLQQNQQSLTGTCTLATFPFPIQNGNVTQSGYVSFSITVPATSSSSAAQFQFVGSQQSNGSLSGTYTASAGGKGPWSVTKS